MIRIFWIFIFLLVSVLGLEAANNTCLSVETISQLNNKTTAVNRTITGSVGSNITNIDPSDYFSFTAGASGVLQWNIVADKQISVYVQKECKLVPSAPQTTNASGEIAFKKGETIYVSVHRTVGGKADYTLNLSYQPRSFTASFSDNFKGDVVIIGNTILGQKSGSNTICPGDSTGNHYVTTRYYNVDGTSSNTSSSSANLTLTSGAEVKKAFLYWQGLASSSSEVTNANSATRKIKLKTPTTNGYKNLESVSNRFEWTTFTQSILNGGKTYYPYQGFVDVTDYVEKSGTYTVANLITTTGKVNQLGTYGAWAIVVIYADDSATLKNITVFDGYDEISTSNNKEYSLSGFYTPEKGVVNSKLLIFAGEGDVQISGDSISLDGTKLNGRKGTDNAFSSGITRNGVEVTDRNPYCYNNLGIDIHTFDVGNTGQKIIKNSQSSAKVKLASTQDTYYPSVFAFATDLYEPNVCYDNEKVYLVKGGNEIELKSGDPIPSGSRLRIEATIKNNGNETAKKVRISHDYEGFANFVPNSLKINGADQSDDVVCNAENSDKANFDEGYINAQGLSIKKAFFHLGNGATCMEGGEMKNVVNDNSIISFAKDLNGSGNLVLRYKVDYSQGATDIPFVDTQISHCEGKSPFYSEIRGAGEIVVYEKEINNHKRLLTKHQDWASDVRYTFARNIKTNHQDNTLVKVYKKPLTREDCKSIAINWDSNPNDFATGAIETGASWDYNIKGFDAAREYVFAYKINESTAGKDGQLAEEITGCTDESFAIRPAFISIENDTFYNKKVKDSINSGAINAKTKLIDGNNSKGYNQTLEFSKALKTVGLEGCVVNQLDETENSIIYDYANSLAKNGSLKFTDGVAELIGSGDISFADVGKFELVLNDSDWTSLDSANSRCEQGSSLTPNANGQIGCDFNGTIKVEIVPNELNITVADQRKWSYMADQPSFSEDDNLSHMHLTGVVEGYKIVDGKELAKNLHGGCYEPSVIVSLTSDNEKWKIDHEIGDGLEHNGGKDNSETYLYHLWKNSGITHEKGQFENGEAYFSVFANVNRTSPKLVKNPESLKLDLELKSELEGKGTNLTKKIASHDHTFYYGRIYAPRNITSYVNSAKIDYQVEIYCPAGGCMGNKPAMLNKWVIADQDSLTKITSKEKGEEGKKIEFASGVFSWGDAPVKQHDDKTIVYHHSIPSYLWYGAYVKDYEFDSLEKTDCLSHPCTEVKFQGDQDEWGGTAGDQEKNRIKAEDKSGATQDIRPRINW